jgi:hypothetical protein
LHRHDLRHEGACRLLADGVDIRTIQLMLGHSDIKTTQRYLDITDEEARKALTGVLPDDFNAAVGLQAVLGGFGARATRSRLVRWLSDSQEHFVFRLAELVGNRLAPLQEIDGCIQDHRRNKR